MSVCVGPAGTNEIDFTQSTERCREHVTACVATGLQRTLRHEFIHKLLISIKFAVFIQNPRTVPRSVEVVLQRGSLVLRIEIDDD